MNSPSGNAADTPPGKTDDALAHVETTQAGKADDESAAQTVAEQMTTASPISPVFQTVIDRADSALTVRMDNPVLKVGEDLLRFEVTSSIKGHVTVYVLTSEQSPIQLLPNARVPTLPIEAGKPLMVPPPREPIQAAGPAGVNEFLVVVTEQPRSHVHLGLQDHCGFGLIDTGRLNSTTASKKAGLEGISPCEQDGCQDRMAAAWFSVDEVD